MLRLQVMINDENASGITTVSHTGSQLFPPEKLGDPDTQELMRHQLLSTMLLAKQKTDNLPPPSLPAIDHQSSTRLRELAALIDSGKCVTSFEKITQSDGKYRITLTLDPTKK